MEARSPPTNLLFSIGQFPPISFIGVGRERFSDHGTNIHEAIGGQGNNDQRSLRHCSHAIAAIVRTPMDLNGITLSTLFNDHNNDL